MGTNESCTVITVELPHPAGDGLVSQESTKEHPEHATESSFFLLTDSLPGWVKAASLLHHPPSTSGRPWSLEKNLRMEEGNDAVGT